MRTTYLLARKQVHQLIAVLAAVGLMFSACAGPSPQAEPVVPIVETPQNENLPQPGQATFTPEPVYAISGGVEMTLPVDRCMDLDNGSTAELEDTACDFGISLSTDENTPGLIFIPLTFASYDFTEVFWDLPDADTCSLTASYSSGPVQLNPDDGYYVCYQTNQGHWGMLNFRVLGEDGLTFYWITYQDQTDLISHVPAVYPGLQSVEPTPAPSRTPTPDPVLSQASGMWVKVDQGIDLDSGTIRLGWNGEDDLVVSAGEVNADGRLISLLLQPAGAASLQVGSGLEQPPHPADCKGINQYSTQPLSLEEVYRYRCFQTSQGRMGYIFVHESNPGVGVRLDWVTWPDVLDLAAEPAASPTALESGAALKLVTLPQADGVKTYIPGRQISFTWQLTNTGKVTWNTRYALVLARGTALGGPEKKRIPYPITNGMTIRLALTLTVPQEPGTYLAEYWLEDDTGRRFGTGENGSRPLQLIINSGEPGITLAEGQAVTLAPGACFDLDTGYQAINDPACDFTVNPAADGDALQILSSQTAFDFITPLEIAPTLGRCKLADLSSGVRTVSLEDWYVCFKTQQGRYGWLKILDVSSQGLLFDWKTFR